MHLAMFEVRLLDTIDRDSVVMGEVISSVCRPPAAVGPTTMTSIGRQSFHWFARRSHYGWHLLSLAKLCASFTVYKLWLFSSSTESHVLQYKRGSQ